MQCCNINMISTEHWRSCRFPRYACQRRSRCSALSTMQTRPRYLLGPSPWQTDSTLPLLNMEKRWPPKCGVRSSDSRESRRTGSLSFRHSNAGPMFFSIHQPATRTINVAGDASASVSHLLAVALHPSGFR